MGWKKTKEKLLNGANDITFDEICNLLIHLGYEIDNKGKTSGSRVLFASEGRRTITLHKPHPAKEVNQKSLSDIRCILEKERLI